MWCSRTKPSALGVSVRVSIGNFQISFRQYHILYRHLSSMFIHRLILEWLLWMVLGNEGYHAMFESNAICFTGICQGVDRHTTIFLLCTFIGLYLIVCCKWFCKKWNSLPFEYHWYLADHCRKYLDRSDIHMYYS